jgi:hypothetical protein
VTPTARRRLTRPGLALLALVAGCAPQSKPLEFTPEGALVGSEGERQAAEERRDILRSVLQLIRTAATNPAGDNFTIAAEQLNDYFRATDPEAFDLPEPMRKFLESQELPQTAPRTIMDPHFVGLRDGRHIEDCLMYRGVARGILERAGASASDDLARARAIFAWVVEQVQLVPPGSLAPPDLRTPDGMPFQAQARPYDVLLRGMATEVEGGWAERSWLYLSLCRQVGLDAALLVVVPPPKARGLGVLLPNRPVELEAKTLGCGVLIGGRVYLFDARLGVEIPAPGGGVATLEQAATDPSVLDALDLPEKPYPLHQADLAKGRVHVMMDATLGSLAPRMRLLQEQLAGENRMVLYRDPTEVAAAFGEALGGRLGAAQLWPLPLQVENRLFNDSLFNQATGFSIVIFNARWPLLKPRLDQLRGDTDLAIAGYASFLNVANLLESDGKTPIPPETCQILNLYANHFLALAQLDKGKARDAAFLFGRTLQELPEPGPGRPYYYMFRFGAASNLARLHQAEGSDRLAVRDYTAANPTDQSLGDRLRARPLVFARPFASEEPVPPLPRPAGPPAPGPSAGPAPAAAEVD